MTDESKSPISDQVKAKLREQETARFLKENAAALAEAERIANIQGKRDRGDNLIKVMGSGVAAVVIFVGLMFLFGPSEPEPPKTPHQMREDQVKRSFSSWNGSHHGLERSIKAAMNDPSSFEHVRTTYVDMGEHLIVTTAFRGTNAFGGKVLNTWTARANIDGSVTEIISTQ